MLSRVNSRRETLLLTLDAIKIAGSWAIICNFEQSWKCVSTVFSNLQAIDIVKSDW